MTKATENKITNTAQHWLNEFFNSQVEDPKNPFCYKNNLELHLKYDSIRIKNSSAVDSHGAEVGYYWNGIKVCIFPVHGVTLNIEGLKHSLDLNGIDGSIKMVIIDKY